MKKQKVYILATHHVLVNKETKKREIHEKCEFVNELKTRHLNSATFIIDFLNKKVVKDRSYEGTYEEFEAYVMSRYPDQMQELIEEFRPEEALSAITDIDPIVEEIADMENDSPTLLDTNTIENGE